MHFCVYFEVVRVVLGSISAPFYRTLMTDELGANVRVAKAWGTPGDVCGASSPSPSSKALESSPPPRLLLPPPDLLPWRTHQRQRPSHQQHQQDSEEDQDLRYPGGGPVQGMGKGTPPRGWGQPKALPLLTAL